MCKEGTHKNVRDPQYVGPGAHNCGSRGSWEISGRSGPSNWCSIIVGPGAHGKSLVEADLPIGAVSMSPNRRTRLDI